MVGSSRNNGGRNNRGRNNRNGGRNNTGKGNKPQQNHNYTLSENDEYLNVSQDYESDSNEEEDMNDDEIFQMAASELMETTGCRISQISQDNLCNSTNC